MGRAKAWSPAWGEAKGLLRTRERQFADGRDLGAVCMAGKLPLIEGLGAGLPGWAPAE